MRSRLDLWLYRLDRLGNPGKLGLLCLAASLLLLLLLILPATVQINALTAEVAAQINSRAAAPVAATAANDQPQAAKSSRVSAASTLSALAPEAALRQIFAAATVSGLELERGDYAGITARNAAGNSTQITLPLKGTYPEIRQFIATVVNNNPAIAIEQIRLSRDSANATELSATVRLVAFQEFQGERP